MRKIAIKYLIIIQIIILTAAILPQLLIWRPDNWGILTFVAIEIALLTPIFIIAIHILKRKIHWLKKTLFRLYQIILLTFAMMFSIIINDHQAQSVCLTKINNIYFFSIPDYIFPSSHLIIYESDHIFPILHKRLQKDRFLLLNNELSIKQSGNRIMIYNKPERKYYTLEYQSENWSLVETTQNKISPKQKEQFELKPKQAEKLQVACCCSDSVLH